MVDKLLSLFFIILQTDFFSSTLLPVGYYKFESYHRKLFSLALIVVWIIWKMIVGLSSDSNFKPRRLKNRFFSVFLFLYVLWLFASIVFTKLTYNVSVIDLIISYYYMFIPVLLVFLCSLLDKATLVFSLRWIPFISLIYCGLLILQSLLWSSGRIILGLANTYVREGTGVSILGPFLRIVEASDFVAFAFFITLLVMMRFKRLRIVYSLIAFVELFTLFFVARTRMFELICLVILVLWFVLQSKRFSKGVWLVLLTVLVIVGVASVPVINDAFGFTTGDRASSFTIRIEELRYFADQLFNSPIFGIGFLPNNEAFFSLLHGPFTTFSPYLYYLDDLGVFGSIVQFGLPFIVLLLLLCSAIFKRVIQHIDFLTVGSAAFILLMFPTLSPFNAARCVIFGLLCCLLFFHWDEDPDNMAGTSLNTPGNHLKMEITNEDHS
ncbi:O-antigen ligase family protein [Lacticaseibacillus paracasei]|uniref:O-antigen ligase family protein n=1 Tax=Lacticaseibacillus paracasei TaxID=1597 RepID=UPI003DA28783